MKFDATDKSPAFAGATLDILSNVLSRAADPGDVGAYLTEEIRELTGARCVLFIQCQSTSCELSHRVVSVNPLRKREWAEGPAQGFLYDAVHRVRAPRVWRGDEPSEVASLLRREGFELSMGCPLDVGGFRVGAMLALGLPDERHIAAVLSLLSNLSTTVALVFRNAVLYESQEQLVQERTAELRDKNAKLALELAARKKSEEALHRSNRELRAISLCNQVLMRAADETDLLQDICRIVCDEAGYRLACVGYGEQGDPKTLHPVAWGGLGGRKDADGRLAPAENEVLGQRLWERVARSGETLCIQDFATDPQMAPWQEVALRHGCRSGIGIPLKDENASVFGVFLVYSSEANAISPDEVRLMQELAGDLTFGIGVLRARIERKRAEQSVALLSFALNNVREAAFLIDEEARFRYVNEESCRILGYSRDELLGLHVSDIDTGFPLERWESHWLDLKANGSIALESQHRAKDGRLLPVEVSANYFEFDGRGYNLALARDITERRQIEKERERLLESVQEERSRLRVILDTAPVGISLYLAPHGRLSLLNKAAETILGRPASAPEIGIAERGFFEAIRFPSGELFPPSEQPLSRALRGETVTGVGSLLRQPSGREMHILENSAPLRNAQGRVVGAVLGFQDVTPIREQERLREEFIASAAHELKTPVATIRGYAELLHRWTPEERVAHEARAIEAIDAQTHRIARRVQEMLEVVRFQRAREALLPRRFDLGELASQVVEREQALTPLHRVSLRREGPAPVKADRERLEEVLAGLLTNAVEFSPQGGDVGARVWTRGGEVFFSVCDQGVGIAKQRQAHVFEPFYEAAPSGAPGYRRNVALSLYLSKLVVERHEGHIWLESEEGKGSTFYFSLPSAMGSDDGP